MTLVVESPHFESGQRVAKKREDGDAVHDGRFEEEALPTAGCEIAQLSIGMDDGAFVGGDGVGSVFERLANMVDRRLAGFDVEGSGFEDDVGLGGDEPVGVGWAGASANVRVRV